MKHLFTKCIVVFMASVTVLVAQAGKDGQVSVAESADKTCPIKVGQSVPNVSLKTVDGKDKRLLDITGQKPSLLIFYRGSWCPYCNVHLGELKTVEDSLRKLGVQIIGISPDLPENLKSSVAKHQLNYLLLSDSRAEAALAFGLGFRMDDELYNTYLTYDIDVEKASGEKHHILPIPAAVLVGSDGKVKFVFASPDYKVRVSPNVLLAAAKGLQ